MRHFKFDLRIQLVLIALRKHKGIKQETMCIPLNLDRTSYSRIENGRTAISFGQLQVIAEELGVSTEIIRMFANAFEISDFEHKSIDEILSNFIVANNPSREKIIFLIQNYILSFL